MSKSMLPRPFVEHEKQWGTPRRVKTESCVVLSTLLNRATSEKLRASLAFSEIFVEKPGQHFPNRSKTQLFVHILPPCEPTSDVGRKEG
jgi:hypothetical protein